MQSVAGIFDTGTLSTTPMPALSGHCSGMNMARTRDSVTRQERRRAMVAKEVRSAEDEAIVIWETKKIQVKGMGQAEEISLRKTQRPK